MSSIEYVIIGAGFAGAATAYHLARSGITDVLVLEQEAIPGFHSSGRNAAMIRQCVHDAALQTLARDGAAFLRDLPPDWPEPVQFKQNGSLLLGSGAGWEKLREDAQLGRSLGVEAEVWTAARAKQLVPLLEEAEFDGAVWCGSDGIVDIHALLLGYLKGAMAKGVRVRYRSQVRSIRSTDEGFEVVTQQEAVKARALINASGAWANVIARMTGALELPLRPYRRHLFVSPPLQWVDSRWPFVWDVTQDLYFRPEGGGLLLCACDQQEMAPGDPPEDPAVRELLAKKIQRFMPALSSVSINRSWAGLRTITRDGRFVVGWDPRIERLFWVAGLGGHGVTTSSSVGALAAQVIRGERSSAVDAFSPARFLPN
jgi:D-arginine dehydrogenase